MLLTALVAALLIVGPSPASATPSWLAPADLGANVLGASSIGNVALASDGTAVAAWAQYSGDGTTRTLQVSRRRPGEGFTAPVTVPGTTGVDSLGIQVALDGGSNATIAWTNGGIVATLPWSAASAAPGNVQPLETGGDPSLAVGSGGTAVLAWTDPTNTRVRAAVRAGATGDFAQFATISQDSSAAGGTGAIDAAVGGNGSATVVWTRNNGSAVVVEANQRTPGGAFTPASGDPISNTLPGASSAEPAVVVDPAGRATALWSSSSVVQYAEKPTGQPWSGFTNALQPGDTASSPDAGVAPNGTVVAVWAANTPGGSVVQAAIRPPGGGAFADYRALSGPSMTPYEPLVAVGAGGDALFSWNVGMQEAIYTVQRTAAGVYGPLLRAVNNGGQPGTNFFLPSIGVDNQGNGIATWTKIATVGSDNFYRFQTSSFDAAAPMLSSSVPPGGTAGVAVAMAAAASDRLTPVSLTWAFGDGTTGTGGALSHIFGTAGAFNVSVTATDAVGNAATQSHPVLVAAPPPPKKPRIRSRVRVTWGVAGRRIFLLRLQIGNVPKGAKAELRCAAKKKGDKCPFKRISSKKRKKRTITLFKEIKARNVIGKQKRSFHAGQTLQVRITKKGFIGKVVRYKLEKGKIPSGKNLCLPVGKKKPRQRC